MPSQISDDVLWFAVRCQGCGKERSGRRDVASRGDEDVYDLAVFIDREVEVAPSPGDFDIGFINKPASTDCVAAGSGGVD